MKQQEAFGNARWIGADGVDTAPNIRASFTVDAWQEAAIRICGLGTFSLYLNGRRVSEDLFVPATSDYCPRNITVQGQPFDEAFGHRCYFLDYDIAPYLRPGRNELAVSLGPGFFAQPMYSYDQPVSFGPVRLCYRISVRDAAGKETVFVSDESARWHESIVAECNFFRGEKQDLRRCGPDWTTAPFSHWHPVSLLPPLDTDWQLQECPPDRIIRYLDPVPVSSFAACRVYDAGENVTGWVTLRDEGQAGDVIRVQVSEGLSACGALDEHYIHNQFLEIISDGRGRNVHLMHTWHGFRYFSVSGPARVLPVAVIHSDIPLASRFSSANDTLNWLYRAYAHTQLSNMHLGIPSDCPHLERKGYTGDGQLTCEAALLTFSHQAFLKKWIWDILDCQDRHSGHVQYTAPYTRNGGGPGGWGCAVVTVPLAYARHFGETDVLEAAYPGMCRYIDYLHRHSENGLVTSDRPGEWCLGDWCAPGGCRLPAPFVNTYFLIRSIRGIQETERILGKSPAADWEGMIARASQALIRDYFDPQTGDFAGGVEGANAFALAIGLGDERTERRLIEHYEALGGYDTGIFGTEIVTRVLFDRGAPETAYRLLTSENATSFAGWKKAGATTLWEYWPGDRQRSLSHPMFGAAASHLFTDILGFRQREGSLGWRDVEIAPRAIHCLWEAEGEIRTPLGPLALSYRREKDGLSFQCRVPDGMRAALCVAGKSFPLRPGTQRIVLPAQDNAE